MSESTYGGTELELFGKATHWKQYWAQSIGSYIHGDVLEVGAGLGANFAYIVGNANDVAFVTLLEPDRTLAEQAAKALTGSSTPAETICGNLHSLDPDRTFDTILYIDVMEHIESDHSEFSEAQKRLRQGGNLIVLVPAFPLLFSEFDRSVDHFRRYTKSSLQAVSHGNLDLVELRYLDSVGFFASVANKLVLKQSIPTARQVKFWDHFLVPVSKMLDPVFNRYFGKSLVGVWRKTRS